MQTQGRGEEEEKQRTAPPAPRNSRGFGRTSPVVGLRWTIHPWEMGQINTLLLSCITLHVY